MIEIFVNTTKRRKQNSQDAYFNLMTSDLTERFLYYLNVGSNSLIFLTEAY